MKKIFLLVFLISIMFAKAMDNDEPKLKDYEKLPAELILKLEEDFNQLAQQKPENAKLINKILADAKKEIQQKQNNSTQPNDVELIKK